MRTRAIPRPLPYPLIGPCALTNITLKKSLLVSESSICVVVAMATSRAKPVMLPLVSRRIMTSLGDDMAWVYLRRETGL